jgi:hypothetical protein
MWASSGGSGSTQAEQHGGRQDVLPCRNRRSRQHHRQLSQSGPLGPGYCDGCPLDCTKKTLEVAGFTRVNHLRLNDLGFEKGKTKVSSESVAKVIDKATFYL